MHISSDIKISSQILVNLLMTTIIGKICIYGSIKNVLY